MKIRQRWIPALLILTISTLIVGTVIAGDMMEKPMAGMLSGSDGHHASGNVAVKNNMEGHAQLVLTDIKVDKVPDGHVYLAKDGDFRNGVELGVLEQFSGTVSFDIPQEVDLSAYDSVVIWCEQFDVEIGRADLPKTMM
jgi:hypothetical protein